MIGLTRSQPNNMMKCCFQHKRPGCLKPNDTAKKVANCFRERCPVGAKLKFHWNARCHTNTEVEGIQPKASMIVIVPIAGFQPQSFDDDQVNPRLLSEWATAYGCWQSAQTASVTGQQSDINSMKASPELQISQLHCYCFFIFQASRVGERPRVAMEQKTALFWKSVVGRNNAGSRSP